MFTHRNQSRMYNVLCEKYDKRDFNINKKNIYFKKPNKVCRRPQYNMEWNNLK